MLEQVVMDAEGGDSASLSAPGTADAAASDFFSDALAMACRFLADEQARPRLLLMASDGF